MGRKRRWQSAAWGLSGLVIWAVVWWPALAGGRVIYYSDIANQNLPLRMYVGQSLAEGHVPLWCPAILKGIPLAGQQASEWCPSVWLMALPIADKAWLFTLLTAAVYLLAWYGQWLLARRLGLAAWSAAMAAMAATVFTYCGSLPARHVFVNMIEVMAALPWVVLGADLAAREKGRKAVGGMLLLAAATGWMLTAFYPQIIMFIAAAVLAFGLASRRWRGGWGRVVAGAGVGALLGLPQILPFAELMRWNGAGEPRGYDYLMRYAPRARAILAAVLPGLWGRADLWLAGGNYHDGFVTIGAVTVCLSITAIFIRRQRRRFPRLALLAIGFVAVCLSFPYSMPLYRLLGHEPVIGSMRALGRWWFVAAWALSLVAAWTAQETMRMQSAAKIARRVASVVGVGAGLLVILASVLSVNGNAAAVVKRLGARTGTVETLTLLPGHWAHEYGLTGPGTWALIVGVGAIFALPWLRKRRNLAPILLVLAVAIEGVHVARLGVPMLDSEPVYARPWAATVVGDGPIIREPDDMAPWAMEKTGLEAIDPAVQRIESELMIENRPQLWSVEEVDGYETKVLLPRDLMELLKLSGHSVDAPALSGDAGRKRAVVLGLLGTKYLVGRAETKLDAPGFTAVASHDVAKVWRVDYAQPVARVCGVTRFAGDGEEARRLTAGGWPGLTRAAVVEAPEEIQKVVARDGEGTATVVRALPGYWHVQVVTPLGGMLVIADRAYPGWHAYLDGRAAWWGRAYGTLKCMAVPPGTHDAMMVYRPGSVLVGLWAATVGVALMAAMAVLALWPRRLTKGAS